MILCFIGIIDFNLRNIFKTIRTRTGILISNSVLFLFESKPNKSYWVFWVSVVDCGFNAYCNRGFTYSIISGLHYLPN